jgi:hypothetical protein
MDYLFALWKYWAELEIQAFHGAAAEAAAGLAPFARQASGRYAILRRMLLMGVGDLILIPATSHVVGQEDCFSIATVAAQYQFVPVADAPLGSFLRDYGHVVRVLNLQAVEYGQATLAGRDFQAYRYAVNGPIIGQARDRFLQCLQNLGYPAQL